jgi:stage II sporulation SpoE-like protein
MLTCLLTVRGVYRDRGWYDRQSRMDSPAPKLEPKFLYRRLDSLLQALDAPQPARVLMKTFLGRTLDTLGADLRLEGAVYYAERRDGFTLLGQAGTFERPPAETLDLGLAPIRLALQYGVYIFADPDHDDAPARFGLLPRRPCAAVVLGRRPERHLLFFMVGEGWVREELDFALNTVRAALGSRLTEERMRGSLREAAEIQQSLLLEDPPPFEGFELAAHSVPAEEVGGDFYDFIPFEDELIGLAIGDASGHGLPAALLVRDVVTGLRMGLEKDLKIAHVFRKLNSVIHRSNLSSRFVSVFYGELERGGNMIYVNAGHQPPLLFSGERVIELSVGGTVIGPLPGPQFRRGVAYLETGDRLVLCTDGILERRDRSGEFFGEERLRSLVQSEPDASAQRLLQTIFDTAFAYGGERPWEDDATAVVVRRTK